MDLEKGCALLRAARSWREDGQKEDHVSPKSSPDLILKFPSHQKTITVSRNVAKRAVDRNRIKRITKEAVRQIGQFPENYAIIIKRNIANLKTAQVKEILAKLIQK